MRRTVRHVVDTHHHVGTLSIGATEEQAAARTPGDPVDTHHAMLDRFGMTACAVMPGLQYERPHGIVNTREVNDAIAAYRDRSPRFLAALGTVEPLHGLALCREELDRLVGLEGATAAADDVAVVNEEVLFTFTGDEAVALLVVEELDRTGSHRAASFPCLPRARLACATGRFSVGNTREPA